uniref:BHLH domain-containing protein n=1 Tax=Leersia perrieri TaxID=77586 RepID=A0A0D9XTW2_9ORYZ
MATSSGSVWASPSIRRRRHVSPGSHKCADPALRERFRLCRGGRPALTSVLGSDPRKDLGVQVNPHAQREVGQLLWNQNLSMVADTESSGSLGGSSNAASDKAVDGSLDKRSQEKAPKKTHKAEREKLKRDQLNDLFVELSSMLEPERQNSGKATVLGDAARVLRDLLSQVESLRKEQSALLTERQYVGSEKNELQEENIMLRAQILELHNELCARMGNNNLNQSNLAMSQPVANNGNNSATRPVPHHIWSNGPNLSNMAMTHQTNTLSPLHNQHHQSTDVSPVHASRPQELQLFPGTSVSTEREQYRVGSTPATSSGLTDSLSGQLRLSLLQSSQEESSGGSKKGRKKG